MNYKLAGAFLVGVAVMAPAQGDLKGSVSLASDYVYRGYSKSRGNPVVQGELDYSHDCGLHLGLRASAISYDDTGQRDRAAAEITPYLGWGGSWGEAWRADLTAMRYLHDGRVYGLNADYNEFFSALHYRDSFTARMAFAYDAYNRKAKTFAYELTWRYRPWDRVRLSVGLGFQQARELLHQDYFYWNAGASFYISRHVLLDVRYVAASAPIKAGDYHGGEFYPRSLERPVLMTLTIGF